MIPAAIRYNNPGAMYPGPSSRRFGSTGYGVIGGGHKIAQFGDPISGAAAQFDLLKNSYAGMPLNALIKKWSGGNSSGPYADFVAKRLGITPDAVITAELLRNPDFGVKLAQAKSQWETGGKFPLDEAGWREAHSRAYGTGAAPGSFRAAQEFTPAPAGPAPGSFRAAQEEGVGSPVAQALNPVNQQDPVIRALLDEWTYGVSS